VVGGAGLVLVNRDQESWATPQAKLGDKVFSAFMPNDIAAIHIKANTDLNLVKRNDVWCVNERDDYPANFGQISDVLIKLSEMKVVEAETVSPSDLPRVNLAPPGSGPDGGTLVEFKDSRGKVIQSILLGRKHMRDSVSGSPLANGSPDGRYLLLTSKPKEALLISDALGTLQPNPQFWLSHDFFKVERIQSIALASTNAAESWKISRENETSPWHLADGKPGDVLAENRISSIVSALQYPGFSDVEPLAQRDDASFDHPVVATVETFDHLAYVFRFGAKTPEGNYRLTVSVTAADDGAANQNHRLAEKLRRERALAPWIYTVNSWVMDPLVCVRSQMVENKKDSDSSSPAKVAAKDP
jgi:hypothetical protein